MLCRVPSTLRGSKEMNNNKSSRLFKKSLEEGFTYSMVKGHRSVVKHIFCKGPGFNLWHQQLSRKMVLNVAGVGIELWKPCRVTANQVKGEMDH